MASTTLELVNSALVKLGGKLLTALPGDTHIGAIADEILPEVRNAVLTEHQWNEAKRRVSLSPISDTPDTVTVATKTWVFNSVDYSNVLFPGWTMTIDGSTNNDATYTISTVTYSTNTFIVTTTAPTSSTADGTATFGPPYDFGQVYRKPTDFLRFCTMAEQSDEFASEGDAILADGSTIEFSYIGTLTDVAKYSPLLFEAMSARIAAELARKIVMSQSTVEQMMRLYQEKLDEARYIDSQQHPPQVAVMSSLATARRNGMSTFDQLWRRPVS